jgi:putative addiction module CopG family antidote
MTHCLGMATKTRNISLPPALDIFVEQEVKSGLYGNASNVVQAGLRLLARERMRESIRRFDEIMTALPQDPITPEIEQRIVRSIRKGRAAEAKARE